MIKIYDFVTSYLLVYYVIIIYVILKPYNHNAHSKFHDLLLLIGYTLYTLLIIA